MPRPSASPSAAGASARRSMILGLAILGLVEFLMIGVVLVVLSDPDSLLLAVLAITVPFSVAAVVLVLRFARARREPPPA